MPILFGFIALMLLVAVYADNKRLKISRFSVKNERLPSAFCGFKVLQISDLHGASFGKENSRLLAKIGAEKPDIIIITGDIINSRNADIEKAKRLCEELGKIAPVFFSSGNHESRLESFETLKNALEKTGVTVLENECADFEKEGQKIRICGLTDPKFVTDYSYKNSLAAVEKALEKMPLDGEKFKLLLAHRPELMAAYAAHSIDLVFSGHAHGGQFRIPLIGGLFVPNQGFFPHYDAGFFLEGKTQMLVSCGLGRSIIPIRLFNPPNLVIAVLTNEVE